MSYKRIALTRADKNDRGTANDRIYADLDGLLGPYLVVEKKRLRAIDTKYFVREIADNFLLHDSLFTRVDIDISIDNDNRVTIKVRHDGNDFNPLAPESPCTKIKAAAVHLAVSPQTLTATEHGSNLRISIKYELEEQ